MNVFFSVITRSMGPLKYVRYKRDIVVTMNHYGPTIKQGVLYFVIVVNSLKPW